MPDRSVTRLPAPAARCEPDLYERVLEHIR
jgi:hypothetical protein